VNSALQGLIAATGLIVLHAPDGHEVFVNPAEVTLLHQKLTGKAGFVESATCLINTTDGKFVTVTENCLSVINAIKGAQQ